MKILTVTAIKNMIRIRYMKRTMRKHSNYNHFVETDSENFQKIQNLSS